MSSNNILSDFFMVEILQIKDQKKKFFIIYIIQIIINNLN